MKLGDNKYSTKSLRFRIFLENFHFWQNGLNVFFWRQNGPSNRVIQHLGTIHILRTQNNGKFWPSLPLYTQAYLSGQTLPPSLYMRTDFMILVKIEWHIIILERKHVIFIKNSHFIHYLNRSPPGGTTWFPVISCYFLWFSRDLPWFSRDFLLISRHFPVMSRDFPWFPVTSQEVTGNHGVPPGGDLSGSWG